LILLESLDLVLKTGHKVKSYEIFPAEQPLKHINSQNHEIGDNFATGYVVKQKK